MTDPTSTEDDPNTEAFLLKKFKGKCSSERIKVMTRNVYVGTNFDQILAATPDDPMIPVYVAQAFALLKSTNIYERAQVLAREVKWIRPHLLGLQEMSTILYQSPGDFRRHSTLKGVQAAN